VRRALEAVIFGTVELDWPSSGPFSRTVVFESHHADSTPRSPSLTGSGPAPRDWAAPEIALPRAGDLDVAAATLVSLAEAIGLPCGLRYSRLLADRATTDPLGSWRHRRIDVFAVTGRVRLANGRFMPVGWSGYGDGLERLGNASARDHLARISRRAGAASPMPGGRFAVVLASQPAALLAHEAIGHFAEAAADPQVDLSHRLGCRLASDGFDIADDPACLGAARYEFDDEGVASAGPTPVVVDGVLVNQLHNLGSADRRKCFPTGNARCAQIALPPIPRMSNLLVPPGSKSFDELVDELGEGIVVHHLSHGFSRGLDVEARIVLAQEVAGGRVTGRFLTGGRVADRIDVLTRCVGRNDRAELNPNGLCGKAGQILYDVGTIAPAMRLSELRILA
jgi:TldD protein